MPRSPHRWFTDRLFAKIDAKVVRPALAPLEARQSGIEDEMAVIRRQVEGINRHLPFLLDRLGQANQLDRVNRRRIDDLAEDVLRIWSRMEFVRNEFMYELRAATGIAEDVAPLTPEIRNPEKVDGSSPLRLNVGCGHRPLTDYVNCDARDLPGVDVIAEAGALPFGAGEVDEIFSAHLLEHFPQEDLRRRLLPYWRSLLRPGGTLRAVAPDTGAMLADYAAGTRNFSALRRIVFGDQEYAGDFHHTMFTVDSIVTLLEETGFVEVDVISAGRENGECLELEVCARVGE